MDERLFNSTDDNVTSSWNESSSPGGESTPSADQLYICDLYKFVTSGIVQLIISVIGLVGKSTLRSITGFRLRKNIQNDAQS